MTTQNLFAYGTLRSDQPEHQRYGPVSLSRSAASVPGELYQLDEGYPILRVPRKAILKVASGDWKQDWEYALSLVAGRTSIVTDIESFPVKGELIELPLEGDALVRPDQWEGFTIGGSSVYQRVVVPALLADRSVFPAWAYVCLDVPKSATLIRSGYWERPQDLD